MVLMWVSETIWNLKKILRLYNKKQNPPSFVAREKVGSIRAKKLNDYVNKIKEEDEKMLNYKFKAKEVPVTVNNYNFNNVGLKASKLNREVKFDPNLYDKHKDKTQNKEEEVDINKEVLNKFKSKALPAFYNNLTPYTNIEKQNLEEKAKRVEERKQQLLKDAALPPRMESAFKNDGKTSQQFLELKNRLFNENHTFKPKINKNIPKFEFDKPLELRTVPKRPNSVNVVQSVSRPEKRLSRPQNFDPNMQSATSGFLTKKDQLFAEEEVAEGDQMFITKNQPDANVSDNPQILFKSVAAKLKVHMSLVQHKSTKKDELARQKLEKENQEREERLRLEKERNKETNKNKKEAAKLFREGFNNVAKSVEMTKEGLKSKIFLFETNGGFSKAVLYYEKLLRAQDGIEEDGGKEASIANEQIDEISVEDIESDVDYTEEC